MTYEEAQCVQINDRTLREWKEKIRNGVPVKPNTEQMKKLREIKNIGHLLG